MLRTYLSFYGGFSRYTWINVIAGFINAMGYMVNAYLSIYLAAIAEFSIQKIGYVIAANGLGFVVGSYIGGYCSDRFPPYRVVVAALLAASIVFFIIPFFNSYQSMLLLLFLTGTALGTFRPANLLLLFTGYEKSDYMRINGLFRLGINLGFGLSTAIGGIIVATVGYAWIFWFAASTSCLAALLLLAHWKIFPHTLLANAENKASANTLDILRYQQFFLLCILFLFANLMILQTRSTYPIYLQDHYTLQPHYIGWIFGLNCLLIVLFEMPLLSLLKNANQILLSAFGTSLIALGMSMLPFGHLYSWVIFSSALWTFGEITGMTVMNAVARNMSHPAALGRSMGIFQAVVAIAILLAPIFGTRLYAIDGGKTLWFSCGMLGVISLFGFARMYYVEKQLAVK